MRQSTMYKGLSALALLVCIAFVGFIAEVANTSDEELMLYQQGAQFQQLPEYVVTGAMGAPTQGPQAPPQGVVMQFPGSQSVDDDEEEEQEEKKLTAEQKAEQEEKAKQQKVYRSLERTKKRGYKIAENMFELKRWLRLKSKEVIHNVKLQTKDLLARVRAIKGTPGPVGPKGTPGTPGANGKNGPHGQTGPPGAEGRPGKPGPPGARGPKGPTGVVGPEGPQGKPGPAGKAGIKGIKGTFGPQGVN